MIAKRSPLEGMRIGTVATVAICELPGIDAIDLRVAPGTAAHAAVADALGIDLSTKPGQMTGESLSGGTAPFALCLAPDWWLIAGLPKLLEKLAGLPLQHQYHLSAVDVSDQRTTIKLTGPHAREVLAHLWEQDLREKIFPVGHVSQGLMAKAPVIVCHMAPFRYRVMVRSSFALHLWKALADAAMEWV